jgi:hypothetical protein
MAKQREYELQELEFKGKAYRKNSRKIIKSNTVGLLTLPMRFIGKTFDIILIPKEVENEKSEQSQAG